MCRLLTLFPCRSLQRDPDYGGRAGERGGLQTMGGEENNIKVSRTFESGIIPKQLFCMHAALDQISLSFSPSRTRSPVPRPPSVAQSRRFWPEFSSRRSAALLYLQLLKCGRSLPRPVRLVKPPFFSFLEHPLSHPVKCASLYTFLCLCV